ncbi:MAG: hypothetical protein LBU46_03355 [Candidatus Accumulibacter sp.]|jgi:hypothetical protein|nr:hypothetical protein [Accumulibacter sp.]
MAVHPHERNAEYCNYIQYSSFYLEKLDSNHGAHGEETKSEALPSHSPGENARCGYSGSQKQFNGVGSAANFSSSDSDLP